jgi:glycosyltransferase involved in cell wall biosynthesis
LIAFHYPPLRGSSGLLRTLKFAQYLPDYGWRPLVLTVRPSAYPDSDSSTEADESRDVRRAFAFDSVRRLSFGGRYPRWLAWPDRWISWYVPAVSAGLGLIGEHRPDVIWSTFPIPTSHLIAITLRKLCRLPWIADFRDSMTEDHYPVDPGQRAIFRGIERWTVRSATRVTFTAPGTTQMYAERYPDVPADRWTVVYNGYDDADLPSNPAPSRANADRTPVVLVHSGLLYRSERDPRPFFAALGDMRRSGEIAPGSLRIILRASGDVDYHRSHIDAAGVGDIVLLEPAISHHDALAEMTAADGLLLFQASNCNHQIPAKLYEYLAAGRPVLALTDPAGDTAGILRRVGGGLVVPLDSRDAIRTGLREFLTLLRNESWTGADPMELERFSRRRLTGQLSELLEQAAARR